MVSHLPYSDESLFAPHTPRWYEGDARRETVFYVGGIGTGHVGLSAYGELVDWEIFNRPARSHRLRYTFLSLWAQPAGRPSQFRVLEARRPPAHSRHHTRDDISGAAPSLDFAPGFPRFPESRLRGEYPFGEVQLRDPALPLAVSVHAWNPLVPLNADESSLPLAILEVDLHNLLPVSCDVSVAFSMENHAGVPPLRGGPHQHHWRPPGDGIVRLRDHGTFRGLEFTSKRFPPADPQYGELTLTTNCPGDAVEAAAPWLRGRFPWDGAQHFLNTFGRNGRLDTSLNTQDPSAGPFTDIATLAVRAHLAPGETTRIPFLITWYFPTREGYWHGCQQVPEDQRANTPSTERGTPLWKNWYAARFASAWEVAQHAHTHRDRLERETRAFHNALFQSTLPAPIVDAATANLAILRSPTTMRLEDGTFYTFEGSNADNGCCHGTCAHVWNYAQALAFLFPTLERSARTMLYEHNVDERGHLDFRIDLPHGARSRHRFHAAADGLLGNIVQLWRDFLLSGDREWLARTWPIARRTLDYAIATWDPDHDGSLEGTHHNTYDIEFLGPEPMTQGLYVAALMAARNITGVLGHEHERRALAEREFAARQSLTTLLRNGAYRQLIDDVDAERYQYGNGILSDQLLGEFLARVASLAPIDEPERLRTALRTIFHHNWCPDVGTRPPHAQRTYAQHGDAGLLLCTWPEGGRPAFPFIYSDEVWYGVEYQVAATMLWHGLPREALAIVRGARDRHDGHHRNPWNEVECGNYYIRSLASFALVLAATAVTYDASRSLLTIAEPSIPGGANGRVPFFAGIAYGSLDRDEDALALEVIAGNLPLAIIDTARPIALATLAGEPLDIHQQERPGNLHRYLLANAPLQLHHGTPLLLTLTT